MMRTVKGIIVIIILAVVAAGFWGYVRHSEEYPATDDAYVKAHVVYIAAQVSGKVQQVMVHDLQKVKKGQVLFTIESTQYQNQVAKAKAQLAVAIAQEAADQEAVRVAKAQLQQDQANLFVADHKAKRILALVKQRLASAEQGDEVQGDLNAAKAEVAAANEQVNQAQQNAVVQKNQVKVAQAALQQARLNLSWTSVCSPVTGAIANFSLHQGAMVNPGRSLFAVVDTQHWWVTANYKETALARIKPGQQAKIVLDLYPDHAFLGNVQHISRGSGSTFALLPPENATGNWVKVIQRFPVRIEIPASQLNAKYPLRVGASASVRVNTLGPSH